MLAPRPNTREGYQLFHDATIALSRMEHNGIRVDVDYLDKAIGRLKKQVREREHAIQGNPFWADWSRRYGEKANIGSDKQLGAMLKGAGIKLEEDEFTGHLKVDKHALSRVDMPFVRDLVSLRENKKVLDTYLRGIRRETDDNGYLHPSYNLASGDDKQGGAESYRTSCSDPNFQNIPIRNAEMRSLIRPAFIPRPGQRTTWRDFSGIEVKMAACGTKDKKLIRYVTDPTTDMHRDTAMDLFVLSLEEVARDKKTFRDCAKNQFVFPQFYGSVYFQCAPAIWESMEKRKFTLADGTSIQKHLRRKGITELGDCSPDARPRKGTFVKHVQEVERIMWDVRFAEYTKWKKDWYALYLKRGWFPLKSGFVCQGYMRRNQVLNFRFQGEAAHCMCKCIVEVDRRLLKYKMKTVLIAQIHDDLGADGPDDELQDYLDMSEEVMSDWLPKQWPWLIVPMTTEVDVTPIDGSWDQKKEWKRGKSGKWRAVA